MADDPQREVLSSLPRSRPVRRSSKRSGNASATPEQAADAVKAAADESADAPTTTKPTAPRKAGPSSAPKRKKPATAKAKPGAKAKAKAAPTAKAKAESAAAKAKPTARRTAGGRKIEAVPSNGGSASKGRRRAPSPEPVAKEPTPPAGWATPEDAGGSPPGPVETVTTAVRAVGELAQLGAAVGGQAVKGLLSRIPKP
jgi:hypothetical protein